MEVSSVLNKARRYWRPALVLHLLFTLLGLALFMPLFSVALQGLLALSGSAAVADQEIALLLLSPLGLASAIFLVGLLLAIAGLELGALQAIAQGAQNSLRIAPLAAVRFSLINAQKLLRLTIGLTVRVLVYLLPFVAAMPLAPSPGGCWATTTSITTSPNDPRRFTRPWPWQHRCCCCWSGCWAAG